jgi:hypothetical protein
VVAAAAMGAGGVGAGLAGEAQAEGRGEGKGWVIRQGEWTLAGLPRQSQSTCTVVCQRGTNGMEREGPGLPSYAHQVSSCIALDCTASCTCIISMRRCPRHRPPHLYVNVRVL